jgi:hypothetical protein
MRSKFGTALALTAVLLTGTAAAAINTQALITPTKSTVGTATTSLLPPTEMVAVESPQPNVVVPEPGITPVPGDVSTPVFATNDPTAIPNIVYGNPNPSTGEEDEDDEEYDDDDDEDDEDEDDDEDDDEYEDEDDD